ncbi:MAG: hypothetical protein ABIM44_04920 [candidate division WOR-3 bacterium]
MAVIPPGLAPGTPKERFDYELLYEKSVTNPSTLTDLPSVELDADERAEIVECEVLWPKEQPSGKLIPMIDGETYAGGSQVVLRVGYLDNVAPQSDLLTAGFERFKFGTPMTSNALENTTLKVKSKMAARIIPDGSVTGTVTVRYWGYRYKGEASLRRAYPGVVSLTSSIPDMNTGRTIYVTPKTVPVSFDTWDQLPGGQKQSKPIVHPLIRYAINALATTANTPYDFRFTTGGVATEDQDLYFDLTPERAKGLVLIGRVGIRAHANLKGWAINVNGELRPDKNWVPARTTYNPYHFGHVSPFLPETINTGTTTVDLNLWYPLRKLPQPVAIWREIGRFQIIDNGTSIPAGGVTVAVKGVQIIE